MRPSMYTFWPLCRYFSHVSASCLQATMLNHSVSSLRSPVLDLYDRLTASENFVKGVPSDVTCNSGSLPRFPMSMILLSMVFQSFQPFVVCRYDDSFAETLRGLPYSIYPNQMTLLMLRRFLLLLLQ